MSEQMIFFVAGNPVPKGSAKAFVIKGTNRAIVTQTNREKQKPWASMIGVTAQEHVNEMLTGPLKLSLQFVLARPKSHYRTGKNAALLRDDAPYWHTNKPDLDKLIRCVKDALTGVVWQDDSQVAQISRTSKRYGDHPGVIIEVLPLDLEG
jgi:Holliday junction resolvase RusA-like endonuclease